MLLTLQPRNRTDKEYTVHVITHSHTDAGWLQVVDDCQKQVNTILTSVVQSLKKNKQRTYSIGDLYFFEQWYKFLIDDETRADVKSLLKEG